MPIIPKPEFLANVRTSGIIKDEKLEQWLADHPIDDCATLARAMAKDNLLTLWQAKYLLSGRTKLHLGNYRLLERLSRGPLGDRFLAVHLQLDRKVEIQVLPNELATSQRLRDQFLDKASRAATLDHPNLVHVFDIDRESGRYILVCERIEGQTLPEVPADDLSDLKIARIIQGALAGIKFASDQEVFHGEVDAESIVITPGFQAKIKHIALSRLRKQLTGEPSAAAGKPDKDIATIAEIGLDLLSKSKIETPDRVSLVALLETTQAEPSVESLPLSLGAIEDWIAENAGSEIDALPIDPEPAAPIPFELPVTEDLPAAKDMPVIVGQLPVSPQVAPPPVKTEAAQPEEQTEPEPKKQRNWIQKNPKAVIGIAATLAFLVLGGTIALAHHLVTREPTAVVEEKKPPVRRRVKEEEPKEPADLSPEGIKKSLAALQTDAHADSLNPSPENPPIEDPPKDPVVQAENPKDPEVNMAAKPPEENSPPPADPEETAPEPTETVSVAPPEKSPEEAAPAKKNLVPKNLKHEFEKTARSVQLPESTDTTEIHVGDVFLSENTLLGAELLAKPEISKSKNFFAMARSTDDKQSWIVTWKGRPTATAVKVAQFKRVDSKISFQWLPAAADHGNANYLRNCKLKLLGPSRKHWVDLREAITLTGLQISEESHEVEIETELGWLPHPDALQIEVSPFRVNGDVVLLNPGIVARKNPARVFFSKDEAKQYFWLQVDAQTKKKLKLEISLQILVNGKAKVAKKKMVEEAATRLKRIADSQIAAFNQIKGQNTPQNYPGGFDAWKKFKQQANQESQRSLERATTAIRYEQLIEKLYQSGIPVVVKFKTEDSEIILAKTEFDETSLKPKRK